MKKENREKISDRLIRLDRASCNKDEVLYGISTKLHLILNDLDIVRNSLEISLEIEIE